MINKKYKKKAFKRALAKIQKKYCAILMLLGSPVKDSSDHNSQRNSLNGKYVRLWRQKYGVLVITKGIIGHIEHSDEIALDLG